METEFKAGLDGRNENPGVPRAADRSACAVRNDRLLTVHGWLKEAWGHLAAGEASGSSRSSESRMEESGGVHKPG